MLILSGIALFLNVVALWCLVLRSLNTPHTTTSRRVATVALITPFVFSIPFFLMWLLYMMMAG